MRLGKEDLVCLRLFQGFVWWVTVWKVRSLWAQNIKQKGWVLKNKGLQGRRIFKAANSTVNNKINSNQEKEKNHTNYTIHMLSINQNT